MNAISYVLIVAACLATLTFEPARATIAGSAVGRLSQPSVTYVHCRRTYHCAWKTKEDGSRVRRCHVCGASRAFYHRAVALVRNAFGPLVP